MSSHPLHHLLLQQSPEWFDILEQVYPDCPADWLFKPVLKHSSHLSSIVSFSTEFVQV